MARELKSASKNQPLRLTLRAVVASIAFFWVRSTGGAVPIFIYVVLLLVFYIRPLLHAGRFLPSMVTLGALPFVIPKAVGVEEWTIGIGWGILYVLLLGVKNLVILHRKETHYFVHLALVAIAGALLFRNFHFTLQIWLFVLFVFLFREFYLVQTSGGGNRERLALLAGVGAFLSVEIAWIISFLPINFFASAILLTLSVFAFHDTALHQLNETLSREIVLRNALLLGVFGALVLVLPA